MKLNLILTMGLSALVLSSSTLVFASKHQILCPSVESVKQSAQSLDLIWRVEQTATHMWDFQVKTKWSDIHTEDANWQVDTWVNTSDFNSALNMAQITIKNITQSQDKYAKYMNGVGYVCVYMDNTGSGETTAVTHRLFMNKIKN